MSTLYSTGYVEGRNNGASFAALFGLGVIEIYSGPQPASADEAPTGVKLARITRDGAPWVPGAPGGGLQFVVGGRYITKHPDHQWRLTGLADGVAGWFRLLGNAVDPGDYSLSAPRIDGAIALVDTPGEVEMFMVDTTITPTTSFSVPHWWHGTPPLP